ncbi:MAG: hypothetical protein HPY84_04150 [Syntrophobacteraceae bacterium]|jgi:hypothetical protein|nr:hypothetical protein [Syntrophobacteraceae bacterium]
MADRKTQMKDSDLIPLPVAASTLIEAGRMVAVNASGHAVKAADAAGLKVMGKADMRADNSNGQNGDIFVLTCRKMAFKYRNSPANAVGMQHIGSDVYIEDDETVSSSGGVNSIVAGRCLGIENDGVWVEIG